MKAIWCRRKPTTSRVAEGSVVRNCSRCAHEIWVSPSSLEIERDGATLFCVECGSEDAAQVAALEKTGLRFHEAQVAEAYLEIVRRAWADEQGYS